jgi:DNA-binding transcriptional regulator YdaS (Cro superfamily)
MKLDEWLTVQNEKRSAFAARLGTSAGYVTDLCQASVRPSLKMAQRIMIATEGAVKPEDFFGEPAE